MKIPQFEAIPLNLLGKNNKAGYCVTGNFANKSYSEIACVLSLPRTEPSSCLTAMRSFLTITIVTPAGATFFCAYTYIPKELKIEPDSAYIHICNNLL